MNSVYCPSEIKKIVANIDELPSLNDIVADFLTELRNPNASAKSLAEIISRDTSMAARVLKIANSAFYSFSRQITSLEQAVSILGNNTLKGLVLAASLKHINKRTGLLEKMLLEDSIGCAIASRALATRTRKSLPDDAFVAGLLRHVGKLAMLAINSDNFRDMIAEAYNKDISGDEIEQDYYDYSHSVYGSAVLDNWNFAETMVKTTYYHNNPEPCSDDQEAYWLAVHVNAAGAICKKMGLGTKNPDENLKLSENYGFSMLDIHPEEIAGLIEDIQIAFDETIAELNR